MSFSVTLDVPDLSPGVVSYGEVFGFVEGAQPVPDYAILEAEGQRLDPIRKTEESRAAPAGGTERRYSRHWTPVHLDFHVEDLETTLASSERLGGRREAFHRVLGRRSIAFCGDPFGHEFCVLGEEAEA